MANGVIIPSKENVRTVGADLNTSLIADVLAVNKSGNVVQFDITFHATGGLSSGATVITFPYAVFGRKDVLVYDVTSWGTPPVCASLYATDGTKALIMNVGTLVAGHYYTMSGMYLTNE